MRHHVASSCPKDLTHWGRVTHICVSKLTIIGSDNDLSPGLRQAIIWTNAGLLLIGPLGTNFSEILIEIIALSFKKMHLKMSSAKWRPFCLGLNVLINRMYFTFPYTMHIDLICFIFIVVIWSILSKIICFLRSVTGKQDIRISKLTSITVSVKIH